MSPVQKQWTVVNWVWSTYLQLTTCKFWKLETLADEEMKLRKNYDEETVTRQWNSRQRFEIYYSPAFQKWYRSYAYLKNPR